MDKETVGFEMLYESHIKAQRGVTWKGSVAGFSLHGLEQVQKLADDLATGKYTPRPTVAFSISKPKPRDILAVAYQDRVYQRSINDNVLYPVMTKSFVKENGACQTGRGTDYCINLLKKNMRRFYINHGCGGYFLQIDVRKYYPSMRHDRVKEMFQAKLDDEAYRTVASILDWQYPGEIGYNPGSQMVQIAGISFLDGVDHFIKEKLRIKDYVRVMDDMVLIHEDKEYLKYCLEKVTEELHELGLTVNPKKTRIVHLKDGITFLGFRWRLTKTGKVIMKVKRQSIKETKNILTKLMRMYARGMRSRRCIEDSFRTRISFISKGNSYKIVQTLKKWFAERMVRYERERQRFLSQTDAPAEGTCGV